uniref:Uncharacterized protein n=1 Tax=Arundo donax TaxID=35708 RepID=A0A0A9F9W6_ARUDO
MENPTCTEHSAQNCRPRDHKR